MTCTSTCAFSLCGLHIFVYTHYCYLASKLCILLITVYVEVMYCLEYCTAEVFNLYLVSVIFVTPEWVEVSTKYFYSFLNRLLIF